MNKVALVTGGSRGLGKEMALRIADKGLDLIITYQSNEKQAQQTVEAIISKGQQAAAFRLEASRIETFDPFVAAVKTHLLKTRGSTHIDFLINNAGIGINAPITKTTEDQFDTLCNIHLKGVYFLTQKIIPMLPEGGGIINISTGLARFSGPGYSAYAMMKGGIEVFSRYLAKELGPKGIRANTIAPGAIETDFGGGAVRDNQQYNQAVASVTALGRPGLPQDIGGVVAFLCTEAASWINAQRIEISGGMNI